MKNLEVEQIIKRNTFNFSQSSIEKANIGVLIEC